MVLHDGRGVAELGAPVLVVAGADGDQSAVVASGITTTMDPIAARGMTSPYHPTNKHQHTNTLRSTPNVFRSTTRPSMQSIALHRTKDGRQYLSSPNSSSIISQRPSSCKLCLNKPVNPWHATENCPYKHPTHIIAKDTRERVMQHNALHGAEKPGFSKSQDLPNATSTPPLATGHSAIVVPSDTTDCLDHPTSSTPDPDPTHDTSSPTSLDPTNEIVDTTYFDVPIPPPIGNNATTTIEHPDHDGFYLDLHPDTYITDPLQYLSYDS